VFAQFFYIFDKIPGRVLTELKKRLRQSGPPLVMKNNMKGLWIEKPTVVGRYACSWPAVKDKNWFSLRIPTCFIIE